ncbi:hypothetical protein GLOIN_2v1699698 [Rhizophagus irregularis DAOM 181602=DAOM 197198]|uniref:Uncharacterized protein n=1 Tax=Rhizophagus irregularis (strain DAOM 181602 / DAOM 197198 / MUCL 43194) TaxID=747089 RepID=A0A2P4P9H7_RHIID|nr:hypothetical protein GLOIN_2v1699698 [Rhizophagus irregularis DAOM 181602=DAOM 197198]POG62021.1 hypothetical protein GLOIN_2v1699698 [Rhizophagus irregularis DAOM 181602=DAOM 197198]GET57364.1 hypothetical protein GLOIN_2v1699698 [Rhizophagus irregularis DAOM 181602=DAOM 197198]|eukprot:XP_025168887.1 hypothetical protein GLOIN_2v1699698 [Rhizophagus irregularis DAOM 181602=DAOM 197198]
MWNTSFGYRLYGNLKLGPCNLNIYEYMFFFLYVFLSDFYSCYIFDIVPLYTNCYLLQYSHYESNALSVINNIFL